MTRPFLFQILHAVRRIDAILATPIFHPQNHANVFRESAFIELVILMRDLVHKSELEGHRVSFDDDVKMGDGVVDVTDAITYARDAVCHLMSKRKAANNNTFSFMSVIGRTKLPDGEYGYPDDICFIYGTQKLYLRRHIVRAFNEAVNHLFSQCPWLDHTAKPRPPINPDYAFP